MKQGFINFNLIDGTGTPMEIGQSMVVDQGRIVAIGAQVSLTDVESVVDLQGKYVMPGLIDCHTHLMLPGVADPITATAGYTPVDWAVLAVKSLKALLQHGVMFIRDLGDKDQGTVAIKRHVQSGTLKGPDMFSAAKVVTMTGGHAHIIGREADGPDEVRKAVREQLKAGADVIKVISSGGVMTPGVDLNAYQFNVDELAAAAQEAHKAGRKITTHCHSTQGIKNSILAGLDCVEHATMLDDEAIDMALQAGTYLVPTLAAPYYIAKNGVAAGIPQSAVDKAAQVAQTHMAGIKKAYDKGVKLAMGTDCGTPFNMHGVSALKELELLVEAGIPTDEVICIATRNGAQLIGIEALYGTLEAGKFANFLVLSANPLDDISVVGQKDAMYQKGQLVV